METAIGTTEGSKQLTVAKAFNEALEPKQAPTYPGQRKIRDHYDVVGFISSGTYGRVYKAVHKGQGVHAKSGKTNGEAFAIKKFKPDKEGEVQYTGISQSAVREMSLCTELSHENVIHLVEIILESKCIFMIFEYAEHDLLQIIHWHTQHPRTPVPGLTLRSIMYQLLDGLLYLHKNWVMHRDLKPANIMVTSAGRIKIGDLGLARLYNKPLQPLFSGDKVVVTIWYRAPELLLGSRHYTPAIDLWAVGCIFAELMSLRPIFKGEEAKQENKKTMAFQANQMVKIAEILGLPKSSQWPLLTSMPEYGQLASLQAVNPGLAKQKKLDKWWETVIKGNNYSSSSPTVEVTGSAPHREGLLLMQCMLEFDPLNRITAEQALQHAFFQHDEAGVDGPPAENCFEGMHHEYPTRKVSSDDNDISVNSLPGTKRNGLPDDRPAKRVKEG